MRFLIQDGILTPIISKELSLAWGDQGKQKTVKRNTSFDFLIVETITALYKFKEYHLWTHQEGIVVKCKTM